MIFYIFHETLTLTDNLCITPLQFYVNLNMENFYIKLCDGTMMDFPNRLGDVKYKFFCVSGDARVVGIKIK